MGGKLANTYTQLYVHLIFATQNRLNVINPSIKDNLQKYITGIIKNKKSVLLAMNMVSDHLHILISQNPNEALSDIVRDIKSYSSKHINEQGWLVGKFHWQTEYGAFSYSKSQVDTIKRYIENQEEHHKKKSFREEYLEFLKSYDIKYNEEYLFKWI